MKVCKVVGHVWSTKKEERLEGLKLMLVQDESPAGGKKKTYVAADVVGAGVGEDVLVVTGSTARSVFGGNVPMDMTIVGIIDTIEMERAAKQEKARK